VILPPGEDPATFAIKDKAFDGDDDCSDVRAGLPVRIVQGTADEPAAR